jgi:hypothetical protein
MVGLPHPLSGWSGEVEKTQLGFGKGPRKNKYTGYTQEQGAVI